MFAANAKLVTLQRNRKQRSPHRRDMALFPIKKRKCLLIARALAAPPLWLLCWAANCFKMYRLKSLLSHRLFSLESERISDFHIFFVCWKFCFIGINKRLFGKCQFNTLHYSFTSCLIWVTHLLSFVLIEKHHFHSLCSKDKAGPIFLLDFHPNSIISQRSFKDHTSCFR